MNDVSEIKKEIIHIRRKDKMGRDIVGFLVQEANSIADIARWAIKENLETELLYYLEHPNEL